VARLEKIKQQRDNKAVQKALEDITAACESDKNLLAACLPAVRARATIGEISDAMEKVFTRFVATTQCISGVYAQESSDKQMIASLRKRTADFQKNTGRRPRILLSKMGQDGHDRGVKVIATAFADFGFDVDLGPMFQTPKEAARMAVENDVHVLGVSSLAAGHKTLVPKVIEELKNQGASDIKVVVGGIIPPGDYEFLKKAGAAEIFGPGTMVTESANRTLNIIGA
jgi:methylmalonyl-CoA mutase